jgi:hypothetical protein
VIVITAIVVAVALPLYYYRNRIVGWFEGRGAASNGSRGLAERLDRENPDP